MSIPKTIHYCWLSNKPIPKKYKQYMDSWHEVLNDYEFKLWNLDNFDINIHPFVKKCIEYEDWAHASDYIRLWVLYNYGGIYLDCDVEVYKKFDDLLHLPYAFCLEINNKNCPWLIEPAVLLTEKHNQFIKDCLKQYDKIDYNNIKLCNFYMRRALIQNKYRVNITTPENWINNNKIINVFSTEYFSPKKNNNKSDVTYCCHMFNNDWIIKKNKKYKILDNNAKVRFD